MLVAWEQFAYVIYIPFRLWAASARRSSKSTICTRSDRVVFVVESASEVNSSRRHSYAQNHIRSVAFTNYHQYLAQLWSHIHTVCIIFLASEPLTLMNAEQMKLLFADLFCSVFCLYCCVVCVCGRWHTAERMILNNTVKYVKTLWILSLVILQRNNENRKLNAMLTHQFGIYDERL